MAASLLWAVEISAGEALDRVPAALRILSSSHLKAKVSEFPGWYRDPLAFSVFAPADRQPAYVSGRRNRVREEARPPKAAQMPSLAQKGASFPNPSTLAVRDATRESSPAFMGYLAAPSAWAALQGYRDTQMRVGYAGRPQATGLRQLRLGYQEP